RGIGCELQGGFEANLLTIDDFFCCFIELLDHRCFPLSPGLRDVDCRLLVGILVIRVWGAAFGWICSDPSRWEREIRGRKAIAVVPPVGRGCGSVTRRAVLAWDMGAEEEVGYSRCFLRARNAEGATCY
ncbi:hypothetical protein B296_00038652, partial [Ensete ventricosum]